MLLSRRKDVKHIVAACILQPWNHNVFLVKTAEQKIEGALLLMVFGVAASAKSLV